MRHPIKVVVCVVAVIGVLSLGLLVVLRVPSALDARVSDEIRLAFVQAAGTNLPADKHVEVVSSPRRNATMIFVSGGLLTDEEKERLTVAALEIGKIRDNRPVKVVFR